MMKFKPRKQDIYQIVGFDEEVSIDGIPKDALGSLTCVSQVGENLFHVGTGFNADQRHEMWLDREILIGKMVMVKYQHITSGRGVPRFPVFSHIVEV